jgi:antitoxin component YwqK of YwqJK toxin-antitoxin module
MCRKLNIASIFIFLTVIVIGQVDTLDKNTKQSFYRQGSLKTKYVYNKSTKKWACTEYYINGKTLAKYNCDSNSYFPSGLKKTFDPYGDIVYTVNYKDDLLHGSFIEYFCNGKVKRRGEFYNNFRIGKWLEYYKNGKIKSEQKFKISKSDSLYNWEHRYPDSTRLFPLVIKFGGFNNLEPLPKVKDCDQIENFEFSCTDETYGYDGIKTGEWILFDEKGKIVKKEVFK